MRPGGENPGCDTRCPTLSVMTLGEGRFASILRLAVLRLCVTNACILRGARECVALLDRDLEICVTLVRVRLVAGVGLLRRRVLVRVGCDTVDLGVGLTLDESGIRFLYAHVLRIARKFVTFLLSNAMGRFGPGSTRILARR